MQAWLSFNPIGLFLAWRKGVMSEVPAACMLAAAENDIPTGQHILNVRYGYASGGCHMCTWEADLKVILSLLALRFFLRQLKRQPGSLHLRTYARFLVY